jgi:hypothetical protein
VRPGCCLAAAALVATPFTLRAQSLSLNDYLHDELSPFAMASVTLGAGIGTLQRSPAWWDRDEGFGYRLGTNFASHTADITVRDGLAAVMHEDARYAPCDCRNVFARAGHALISSVLARNERGHYVLGVPEIAGSYAGGMTTAGLYGHGYGWQGGLRLGTEAIAEHAGFNLVKEFILPLVKH